jgi:solute carrier family 25 (mitochondrial carnitine/acylcarnitine transporter), member 20/29
VFLPQDPAWNELHEIERAYLEHTEFAEDDMRKIIDMHSIIKKGVHWSDSFKNNSNGLHLHFFPFD